MFFYMVIRREKCFWNVFLYGDYEGEMFFLYGD
jgi:hypothetical protein